MKIKPIIIVAGEPYSTFLEIFFKSYKSNVLNWLCPSCNSWSSSKPITTFDLIDGGYKNARQ